MKLTLLDGELSVGGKSGVTWTGSCKVLLITETGGEIVQTTESAVLKIRHSTNLDC